MTDPAKWITSAVTHYLRTFNLQNWRVMVFQAPLESEDDSRKLMGEAETDSKYFQASLTFAEDLTPDKLRTVCHEVLHVLFAELETTISDHIIGEMVKPKRRYFARMLYRYEQERLNERFANLGF